MVTETAGNALNSRVQEAPTREACAEILGACTARELRYLADLAYLNTDASPAWLRSALLAERWPVD